MFCAICRSPYRKEIESAFKMGIKRSLIQTKYGSKVPLTAGSFQQTLYKHCNQNHLDKAKNILVVRDPHYSSDNAFSKENVTTQSYAKKLLELGLEKLNVEGLDKLSHRDVIAAQKLLLDEKKIKLSEKELEMQMAKLLSGIFPKAEVIEGEVSEQ